MAQQSNSGGSARSARTDGSGDRGRASFGDGSQEGELVSERWEADKPHEIDHILCSCGERTEWPFHIESDCKHYNESGDSHGLALVCSCGFHIRSPTNTKRACHCEGVSRERFSKILDAVAHHSEHGQEARTYFAEEAWEQYHMDVFTIIRETGYDARNTSIDTLGRVVADGLDTWCNAQGLTPCALTSQA